MNSFNFQIVQIANLAAIVTPFPYHICYFTQNTEKYYIWDNNAIKEIFLDAPNLSWTNITSKPTTVDGFGITDAVKTNSGTLDYVSKFTPDGKTIGNSIIQDDGNNIGISTPPGNYERVKIQGYNAWAMTVENTFVGGTAAQFLSISGGNNTGISVEAGSGLSGTAIGIRSVVNGGSIGQRYAISLDDGTQAPGRFLKSMDTSGNANWATLTTADISGYSAYTLPTATPSVLGGIKIGSGLTITSGVVSVTQDDTYEEVVVFDKVTPTTAGVLFDPSTPSTVGLLYLSSVDSSTWIWNGSAYVTKNVTTTVKTAWNLLSAPTVDAGGTKTARILRSGSINIKGTLNGNPGLTTVNSGEIYIQGEGINLGKLEIRKYNNDTTSNGSPTLLFTRLRGTTSASSYPLSGDSYGKISFNSAGSIEVVGIEDYNTNTRGSDIIFKVGSIGSASEIERLRILQDGRLEINGSYHFPNSDGTASQVLSTDGAGILSWNTITAGLAGSGTLNYLSKWTNGTTLGNSLIQDNGTSVGINTNPASHPSYKLVVYGSGANSSGGLRVVNTTTAGLTNQAVYGAVIESEFTTTNLTITNAVGLVSSSTGGNTTNIGIQSNVNGGFAIGGSFNAGIISFIGGNGNIANPTNYGIYSYVSAVSSLNPSIGHYVNVAQNTGGGGRYSVQLKDGTEGVGKFLKSTDALGKANWATITTADISGYSSGTVVEAKAVYIDSVYGNNATAVKYDLAKPFLTWAAASAVAVAGDWIVFNTGTYVIGQVTPVSNVNVYCKPGVVIDGGFSITTSITWKLLGHAVFLTNQDTFRMTGTGQTYDIQLQFDRISGLLAFGIVMTDTTSPLFKLVVDCNSITADLPFRLCAGANYDVVANFKHKLSGFGNDTVFFHNTVTASMTGTVIINCPIIENTSTSNTRHCLRITRAYSNFTCIINASVMRNTSPTFTDSGTANLASVVVVENVDNLFINGDLEGGVTPCIVSYSPTAVYNTGNVTFTGNMYSDIEIVQHYAKALNGNGWHNIIIKKGYILSKGIGLSNAMFHRADNWIALHGGTPGNIQLVDCIVHNKNFLASAASSIMKDDLGAGVAKLNNFQMYNCLAFITGGTGYLVSTTQAAKQTMMHNVISNVLKMGSVSEALSTTGLIVDPNLIIPTTKL